MNRLPTGEPDRGRQLSDLAAGLDAGRLANPFFAEALFDRLDDVVFFIKDLAGRYVVVNTTLVRRCGLRHKAQLVGRTPLEVFPTDFGSRYASQDAFVLASGQSIQDQLELHLYPSRAPGWCLTHKIPLADTDGHTLGLAGISRDLRAPDRQHPVYRQIAGAVAYLQEHYAQPLRLRELADMAQLSPAQFERYIRRIFDLTPKQLIIKVRLEAAARLLEGGDSVARIAQACGYADHSAFSRQFKAIVGLTPSEYRELQRSRRLS